jgi:hypothetical protein
VYPLRYELGSMSQKTTFSIVTAVKTSQLIELLLLYTHAASETPSLLQLGRNEKCAYFKRKK